MQRRRQTSKASSYAEMATLALGSGFLVVALVPGIMVSAGGVADILLPAHARNAGLNGLSSLLSGLLMCSVGVLHRRGRISVRLLPYAPGAIAMILTIQSSVRLLLTGNPLITAYMLVSLLTTAATVPRLWLLLVSQLITTVSFLTALTIWGTGGGQWGDLGGALAVSEVACVCLYVYHSLARRKMVSLSEAVGRQASRDHLTGLLNRRGLQFAIDALMLSDASTVSLGAIWLDVDGFKSINDQLGHGIGDSVLTTIAERLGTLMRGDDLVVRVGGDEFLVILASVDAASLAEAAHRAQQQLVGTAGITKLPWSVSVGTALGPVGSDADVEALLRAADMAMYAHKSRHRTTFPRTAATVNQSVG